MNPYSGRTSRPCATPGCQTRVMARNPRDTCNKCHSNARTAARTRAATLAQSEWLNWSGPLRDGQPLWRETEPLAEFKPLATSMGVSMGRDELRMAA